MRAVRVLGIGFLWCLFGCSLPAQARTEPMHNTLVRMINQIDNIFPLIDQAANEQDPTARVQFHFDAWRGADRIPHDGLRQSLLKIRKALVDQINRPTFTPKTIAPMRNDFIGR